MANPNNLVRPPMLGNQEPRPAVNNEADLTAFINRLTREAIRNHVPDLIRQALNPDSLIPNVDQAIEARYAQDIGELDKVPDVVKGLREFSGNPTEFNSWKNSVERILKIYENTKGTPKYYGILSVVRNKIVGNADTALESYNTPLDWTAISKCLSLHYADKRDINTLEYQLTSMVQGKLSTEEFYQAVYVHLSLILNKVGSLEISGESLNLLTQTYRDKALDTFIRGLNGDLPRLLGIKEPADLPQALHLCLKLQNQNFRSDYARNNNYSGRRPQFQERPPLPPKLNRSIFTSNRMPFYPQLAHIPQNPYNPTPGHFYQKQYSNNTPQNPHAQQFPNNYPRNPYHGYNVPNAAFIPNRPLAPKPQPKPEPMEVDQSMRTRKLDYANRPQFFGKRPPPPRSGNFQPKIQRNYHVEVEGAEDYNQAIEAEDDQYEQTFEEYLNNIEEKQDVPNEPVEFGDINFLE